jgi:hypothetical protein
MLFDLFLSLLPECEAVRASPWFDTVLLLLGEGLLVFDRLCQQINRSILAIFVQMMKDVGTLKHTESSLHITNGSLTSCIPVLMLH